MRKNCELQIVEIELVKGCNIHCLWCPIDHSQPMKFMKIDLLKKILLEISSLKGVKRIFFVGRGEALLYPYFLEFLSLCEENKVYRQIPERFLFTNATLLNSKNSELICNSPVINKLVFSIDGLGTSESYEYIRQGSKWELVKRNIQNFIEIYKKQHKHVIDYYIRPVIPSNWDDLPFKAITKEEIENNFRKNFIPEIKIELVESHMYSGAKELKGVKKREIIHDDCWRVHFGDFNFLYDGNVLPCCHLVDSKEGIIGNIKKQTVEEIYLGQKYQWIKKTLKDKNRNNLPMCKGCVLCSINNNELPDAFIPIKELAKFVLPKETYGNIRKTLKNKIFK